MRAHKTTETEEEGFAVVMNAVQDHGPAFAVLVSHFAATDTSESSSPPRTATKIPKN
jgi:hypothetical protein